VVNLNENRLRQLLGNINQNPQMKDQYESKWHSVVHFLHNNVGYKIAKVAKAGSQAKHTESRNSDLDIIKLIELSRDGLEEEISNFFDNKFKTSII